MSKRIELIDIAKGICIILVAFSHSVLKRSHPDLNHAMGLFRMPLFFLLAGVFFSASARPKAYIFKKADALLKPYFVTSFFLLAISIVSGDNNLLGQLTGILYGNGGTIRWPYLWFLTHLWIIFIVLYALFHNIELEAIPGLTKIFIVASLLIIGPLIIDLFWYPPLTIAGKELKLPGLPFSLDIIFVSIPFFMSGTFLKEKIKKFTPRPGILLSTSLVFVLIATKTQATVDFNKRIYYEPLFATIAAFGGIYIILSISYYLGKNRQSTKIFTTFGAASLFVLIFHSYIGTHAYSILSRFSGLENKLLLAILAFLASIVGPLFVRKAILQSSFLMLFYFPLNTIKDQGSRRKSDRVQPRQ